MAFERIGFRLTDEQSEALKPFGERIDRKEAANVLAHMFLVPSDTRYGSVEVHLLDSESAEIIRTAIGEAQTLYDARVARAKRLAELAEAIRHKPVSVSVCSETLLIDHAGRKYEVREKPVGELP